MSTAKIVIPYEKQSDTESNRTCGAACLSMVYRSFGQEIQQTEIWPVIAKPNRSGSIASTTYLMTADALNRGLSAVAFQARHPLQVLRLCRDTGIRVILNHRLQRDTPAGHYTVLVDIDDKHVVLHDPFFGPARRLTHSELLELWMPNFPNSEILGNVVIAVASEPPLAPACEFCHTAVPAKVFCPRCQKTVSLQPGTMLCCIRDGCIARMWNYVCCPACDFMWSFNEAGVDSAHSAAAQAAPAVEAATAAGPPSLDKMFAELDKFCAHMLSSPAAETHPELKKQVAFLTASKEQLRMAQAEQIAQAQTHQGRMDALAQDSKQKQEAHRKKMEEMNRPAAPLDGNALGATLLKNLGFK